MKIIYFDICAIPLFLIILFVCYSRKMTKGHANRLFIVVVFLSLFSTIADLGIEIPDSMVPLTAAGTMICMISSYVYLVLRNANNAVLLLFLLHLTHTSFLIRKTWVKIAFALPYLCILVMLALNPFTHWAFTVTAENGYSRGPLMPVFYGIALLYGLVGLVYCIYCRRYLSVNKWAALMSIYVLAHIVVLIQFFYPGLLVELYCTAVGEMLIMLSIMRPEERMDTEVGMLSWISYQSDIRNILLSGEHVKIIVIRLRNYREIRNYLGDQRYNEYVSEIADGIRAIGWNDKQRMELYFERPGIIYLLTNAMEDNLENVGERLLSEAGERIRQYTDNGVRFEPEVCLICVPEDLQKAEDIFSLGHRFQKIDNRSQTTYRASEIVHSQAFTIETQIENILDRAIRENHVTMYYQPIYDVRSGHFRSAEALARIIDPEYGLISPAVFIPAAERMGYMVAVGDAVLEESFRFLAGHNPAAIGLDFLEINLSVAQCMEKDLPEKIRVLQQKYGVDPGCISLEITETTFENISEIMLKNIHELIRMGYSFALDDYGIGYSNIQRINRIPLKLVKIDKSMLEEASTTNGRRILESTVHMMQSIGKGVVAEGAETAEEVGILKNIGCDYIQGYYFSRPLPEDEFLRFIEDD